MDFLERHVVQIDFDEGEARVLKAAGDGCGEPIKVAIQDRMPWVWLKMAEVGELDVLVDFGQVGNDFRPTWNKASSSRWS